MSNRKQYLDFLRLTCLLILLVLFSRCSTNSDMDFSLINQPELKGIDQFINDSVRNNPVDSLTSVSMITDFFRVVDSVQRQESEFSAMSLFAAAEYELFTPISNDSLIVFDFTGLDKKYRNSALASVKLLMNGNNIVKSQQKVIVRFLDYPDYEVIKGYEIIKP